MTERDDALKELGRILTERREDIGMTLESVFDRTKIRLEYLRGIEEGNYEDFPETVYTKGFVRTYLKLIGAEDLQDEFMAQLDRKDRFSGNSGKLDTRSAKNAKNIKNILGNGSSLPEGFKPVSHFWLFLVLIAALVGTGTYVWWLVKNGNIDFKNLKWFNFSSGITTVNNTEISSNDLYVESMDIELVSDDEISEDIEIEEPKITPSLEIHAINDVWLSVTMGSASQPAYRRTLKRGEVVRWELTEPARVVIGRPTAAQVILNGKDLGVVNPSAKKAETHLYNPDGTTRKIK